MSDMLSQVWTVGLDTCDNAVSILARDVSTGTLIPTDMARPINPNDNAINADKV